MKFMYTSHGSHRPYLENCLNLCAKLFPFCLENDKFSWSSVWKRLKWSWKVQTKHVKLLLYSTLLMFNSWSVQSEFAPIMDGITFNPCWDLTHMSLGRCPKILEEMSFQWKCIWWVSCDTGWGLRKGSQFYICSGYDLVSSDNRS